MIYALEAPKVGGATMFADTIAAYAALPEQTRAQIDTLQVQHSLCAAPPLAEESMHARAPNPDATVLHSLVMTHPVTGEKSLFLSGTAYNIVGWDSERSTQLIRNLREHMVQAAFRQSYKAEAGDIVLWDNYAVVHSATPIEYSNEDGKRRVLQRISTKGLPALVA